MFGPYTFAVSVPDDVQSLRADVVTLLTVQFHGPVSNKNKTVNMDNLIISLYIIPMDE
jgi:hypothetical protein